jgi:uncharacterized damage-inducible protein DinB
MAGWGGLWMFVYLHCSLCGLHAYPADLVRANGEGVSQELIRSYSNLRALEWTGVTHNPVVGVMAMFRQQPSRRVGIISQIPPVADTTMETAMLRILSALCLIVMTTSAVRMSAQVYPYRDGTPGVTGYRSEVMAEVMIQESEFVRLAEAIPADRYTWKPSPDVRTIAEVFLHASAANYNLYKQVGTPTPAGVDTKTLEQSTTDKAKVIATLKASYAHAKAAIRSMPDADLEKTLNWNGGKITERGVLLYIVQHIAQHLGQQIAYARSIGVVPPWTLDPPRKN